MCPRCHQLYKGALAQSRRHAEQGDCAPKKPAEAEAGGHGGGGAAGQGDGACEASDMDVAGADAAEVGAGDCVKLISWWQRAG